MDMDYKIESCRDFNRRWPREVRRALWRDPRTRPAPDHYKPRPERFDPMGGLLVGLGLLVVAIARGLVRLWRWGAAPLL